MRILLLGATGNLGTRLVPALLAHNHVITILIRTSSLSKLPTLFSPSLLPQISVIAEGDATNVADIKKAIVENGIEGIVNVAGTQVKKGEFLLPKIAKAVTSAAVEVGHERGKSLRVWITAGLGIMKYPGTGWEIQDFMPKFAAVQHDATRTVVEAIPTTDLRWSLLAIAMMYPIDPKQGIFEPIEKIEPHGLLVSAGSPPGWRDHWLGRLWWIGPYLNVWRAALGDYGTHYENVADFLAEDMEWGGDERVGKRVALKEHWGKKDI
ncbi:uncharacterized protein PAC_07850 [Phialocephala subalpina]|uniref:NAD(P)-binding domain-containing protein n=1 Tax=Phialocephala subalpina TaxID=576137 RepID=A0A1L7WYY6_9HELO|nr:uncharacterized protein PAC_07850 [Phialocephala subalpina]